MNRLARLLVIGCGVVLISACGGDSDPFFKAPVSAFGTTEPIKRDPIASMPAPVRAAPTGPRVLVLYDEPENDPYTKVGLGYAIMLQNLLGHFDANVQMQSVQTYRKASVNDYDTTFYLGWLADNPLPTAFLEDVASTSKRVVWVRSNLGQLRDLTGMNLESRWGFQAVREHDEIDPSTVPPGTIPDFFSAIYYKNQAFTRTAEYDQGKLNIDSALYEVKVTDSSKARVLAVIGNPTTKETAPYVMQSGNFWFVADIPLNNVNPHDRYIAFSDLLHDILGIDHTEGRRAMVRLEDIDAQVNPDAFKKLVDYLYSKNVPFSLAVIPHYKDPYGAQNSGKPTEIPMSEAPMLRMALDYALARGGEILQHGFTHQSDNMINPYSGASGIDYEFWDIVHDRPMPDDSVPWALGRINTGLREMLDLGFQPVAWETPHYGSSPATLDAVSQVFQTAYHSASYYTSEHPDLTPGINADHWLFQFFPYVIQRDRYNLRVLPETMGNLQYFEFGATVEGTSKELLENAKYMQAVRDGFASFYVHPFLMVPSGTYNGRGYDDLVRIVEGLTAMGYTWTSPSRLTQAPR